MQISKFKKALDKHGSERCSLGLAKGLDDKELAGLASIGELKMNLNHVSLRQASILSYKTEEQHQQHMVL